MADLTLEIDHDKTYTTGDIISGRVCLDVKESLDLTSIDVTFSGKSKSRNAIHTGQGYVTKLEKHTLIEDVIVLFPPPEIARLRSNKQLTITQGSYSYPFAFTIPDKSHTAKCKAEKGFFHQRGYPKREPNDEVALAPTYENQIAWDDYCRVEYCVEAAIRSPSMFKFDTKATREIVFHPSNTDMTYSLSHLGENGGLRQDSQYEGRQLKYLDDGTMEVDGFLKRFFAPKGIQVPMELVVDFSGPSLNTCLGNTKRVVQSCCKLSEYVKLSLQTPISGQTWREMSGQVNAEKGNTSSSSSTVRLSSVKVKMVSRIQYFSVRTSRRKIKYTLLDKALDNEITLDSFDLVPHNESRGKAKGELYKYELDPSWYDCDVTDVGQSFITCNIKRNFSLQIAIGIASTRDATKEVIFKAECPIILQKCSLAEGDDLPKYVEPPSYGEDKAGESMNEASSCTPKMS